MEASGVCCTNTSNDTCTLARGGYRLDLGFFEF